MSRISVCLCTSLLLAGSVLPMAAQSSGVPDGGGQKTVGPPSVSRNCVYGTPKVSYVATNGDEGVSTTSTTFTDLTPLSVTFTLPGPTKTCLKVDVSAVSFAPNSELMQLRVLLDGSELLPGEVQFSGNDVLWAQSHSASFYQFGVTPGSHTVDVQWKSNGGNTIYAHWRSLSVLHK